MFSLFSWSPVESCQCFIGLGSAETSSFRESYNNIELENSFFFAKKFVVRLKYPDNFGVYLREKYVVQFFVFKTSREMRVNLIGTLSWRVLYYHSFTSGNKMVVILHIYNL